MSRSPSPAPAPAPTAPMQKTKDTTSLLFALDKRVKTLEQIHAAQIAKLEAQNAKLEAQFALLMAKIDGQQKPSEPSAKSAPAKVYLPRPCSCANKECTYGEEKCSFSITGKAKAAAAKLAKA